MTVPLPAEFGFILRARVPGHNDTQTVQLHIRNPLAPVADCVEESYEVLHILGFSSDRKRMSVIVRIPGRRHPLLPHSGQVTGGGPHGRFSARTASAPRHSNASTSSSGGLLSSHSRSSSESDCGDDSVGSTIVLLCKGADEALFPRLAPGYDDEWAVQSRHLERFASQGLRTLAVASREVRPVWC